MWFLQHVVAEGSGPSDRDDNLLNARINASPVPVGHRPEPGGGGARRSESADRGVKSAVGRGSSCHSGRGTVESDDPQSAMFRCTNRICRDRWDRDALADGRATEPAREPGPRSGAARTLRYSTRQRPTPCRRLAREGSVCSYIERDSRQDASVCGGVAAPRGGGHSRADP